MKCGIRRNRIWHIFGSLDQQFLLMCPKTKEQNLIQPGENVSQSGTVRLKKLFDFGIRLQEKFEFPEMFCLTKLLQAIVIPEFRSSVSSVFPPVEEEAIEEINDPFVPPEESHDEESDSSPDDRPAPVQPTQVSARPAPVQPTRVSVRVNKGIPAVTWADESQTPTYAGLAAVDDEITEPLTHREAMDSPQVHEWVAAMDEELASLKKNEAWELTKIPPSRNIIQNRWMFKLKRDSSGGVQRFKARLVAKGYTQRARIDYEETYSSVVRYDSLRTVLAIAAALDLEITQLDVKTAFLYGDLNEELYMSQPTGFIKKGEEKLVCRLKRSLYGLKQSSRSCNSKFNEFITMYGLKPSVADPCV